MNSSIKLLDCHEIASLSKSWYEIDGKKYLVKGNHVGNTEPIMEVLSSILLDVLNYPHAEYEVGLMNNFPEIVPTDGSRLVSISEALHEIDGCTRMTLENIMVEHAYVNGIDISEVDSDYAVKVLKLMKERDRFEFLKQIHFDAIIGNPDRHFNNVEYYVYDDTKYWADEFGIRCIVPIYDVGASLLHEIDEHSYKTDNAQPFRKTHEFQIEFIKNTFGYNYSFGDIKKIYDKWYEMSEPVMDKYMSVKRKLKVCDFLIRRLYLYGTV